MAHPAPPLHTSIADFVDPKVLTIPVTDAIIGRIYSAFPVSSKVISGYLSEEQLYWKVNYHWDLLRETVSHCLGLAIDDATRRQLLAIRTSLETNRPDPEAGYRKSPTPGLPKDRSSHETILARHALVRRGKLDFKALVEAADLFSKTKRPKTSLQLAFAPVARPAQGKHVTGYALDIKGNNADIRRVAQSLGASLVFDEGSHVHCEWKNGVVEGSADARDAVASAQRGTRLAQDSRIVAQRHCLLRTA